MPLDLRKVLHQIKNLENSEQKNSLEARLDSTYQQFINANKNLEPLIKKLAETNSASKANFTFAAPVLEKGESLNTLINPENAFTNPHITLGSDGSQIFSFSHEVSGASLINIGMIAIPYYEKNVPVCLSSEPTVYNSTEDINFTASEERISDEDLISYERTLKEVEGLVTLAKHYSKYKLPMVALLDGTLIHWHIERFNSAFIEQFIKRYSNAIMELKNLGIPVASLISNSRSNDIINMLKIYKCPYDEVNCKKHCASLLSKDLPCNPMPDYKTVFDRRIMERLFIEKNYVSGARSVLFKSNSNILNSYPDEIKVYFFYINTGKEVARVELPYYVACDKSLLNLLHNAISIQCKVGFGYPVVLSEAHNQAVVNKKDRQIFYDLIKEHTLTHKSGQIKLSTKELKKRISFV